MSEEQQRIIQLLEKFERGEASEKELSELDEWYQSFEKDAKFTTQLNKAAQTQVRENLLNKINTSLDNKLAGAAAAHTKIWPLWAKVAIAAAVLVFLSLTGYFYWQNTDIPLQTAGNEKQDIAPGSNRAVLTLANGKQIMLTGAKNGLLATQGSVAINKSADGQVVYNQGALAGSKAVYNTITTPRGGQYKLTLADGTNVWLNAASSIHYPAAFTGSERLVEITGEAYFEVAHNAGKPFKVQTSSQTVQVLGTHFDVNAYSDEPAVKTTLLEGSVSIQSGLESTLIKPGQQAMLAQHRFKVIQADTDDETAWKNGMFRFSDESLESIMRKISRWYDVDIEYENNDARQLPLTGIITHFTNVSQVLRMLELTRQVHFKIAGKKIIVIK